MGAKVVQFPSGMEALAKEFWDTLLESETDHQHWIDRTLRQAKILAAARIKCATNAEFGRWCVDNRFNESVISHNERAILVQWGNNPVWTRTVLDKTKRKSIEHIHRNEWDSNRLTHVRKTPSLKLPGGPKFAAAKAYVQVYEAETGGFPSEQTISDEAGVSAKVSRLALYALKDQRADAVGPIKFTKAQDHHVEVRLRIAAKAQEVQFKERVRLAMLEHNADYRRGLEELQREATEQRDLYEKLVNNHQPIFTDMEYRDILLCTHEANPSDETRKRAFMTLNAKKIQLIGKR